MKVKLPIWFKTIFVVSILLYGCASYATMNTNKWLEFELPPSKVVKNGSVFFEGKLSDGSNFSVFYDNEIDEDGTHYYTMLMQDWGWRRDGNTWSAPQGSRNIKRGHIYVNPSRRVAVYFYPERQFNAFKVSIKPRD
ncbi:MAG: hypothetical protein ACK417_01565 [Bacteroidia bacterium]